ncbi:MAG: CinA family protein [bacterium]
MSEGMEYSQAAAELLAAKLVARLAVARRTIACAESCTGGWIAQALTSVPGGSDVFPGGIVSYSNLAKTELLGVSQDTLAEFGAVSEQTVREMAMGARASFHSDYAVAVSGIAGPGGGTEEKPVGTVWIAWLSPEELHTQCFQFDGNREQVRIATVCEALERIASLAAPV